MSEADGMGTTQELLTVKEAALFLKVPVSWIYEHVRPESQDRLPVVKLGKYLRFIERDLQSFVNAKRTGADGSGLDDRAPYNADRAKP